MCQAQWRRGEGDTTQRMGNTMHCWKLRLSPFTENTIFALITYSLASKKKL